MKMPREKILSIGPYYSEEKSAPILEEFEYGTPMDYVWDQKA